MKKYTKEIVKFKELQQIRAWLKDFSLGKYPLIFLENLPSGIDDEDVYTLRTEEYKDKNLRYIVVPNMYGDGKYPLYQSFETDFREGYVNRMRVISMLPEEILKRVKDRRLLALGYAEKGVRESIFRYLDNLPKPYSAEEETVQSEEEIELAVADLTVAQENKDICGTSIDCLFSGYNIEKRYSDGQSICLVLRDGEEQRALLLTEAAVKEEEICPAGTDTVACEFYKHGERHELHLLLMKEDENLVEHYYYVTYSFKDMKYGD